jgi:peptide-methionine (S)-S-oxide reductase
MILTRFRCFKYARWLYLPIRHHWYTSRLYRSFGKFTPIKINSVGFSTFVMTDNTQIATIGGGCFWCVEGVFQLLQGVVSVHSGYAGGKSQNPSYNEVCSGKSGHAEVVQIKFDPTLITYEELLQVFYTAHDPTTLNRQGNDVGTQYRSVIYYHSDEQKKIAEKVIAEVEKEIGKKVVTEVSPAVTFYKAEEYHQNYYVNNPRQGYCQAVVGPKVDKFKKTFKNKLKK